MRTERIQADEMLRRVEEKQRLQETAPPAQKQKKEGRLKIFFGYAAGVGKTYAMLEAAHQLLSEGADVVCGYIEPHSRPETMALLSGIPKIPPKEIDYNGLKLFDFDLDAVIARRPQIVLVDELAHTNAQGMRHLKRYQDVEELLSAGISVYTTVNVQHIESLNDLVTSITGVEVSERVPDRIFDRASQVKVIDIEPDDLIERLEEGKIYQKAQAEQALSNFFSRQNLQALREIALRRTADRLNRSASVSGKPAAVSTGEHILLCLSHSPSNAKVIRNAARMAEAFHCRLTAVYVDQAESHALSDDARAQLKRNIRLAEEMGAQIATVYGNGIAPQIAEYAKAEGVTKIVIGRTGGHRLLRGRTLTDRLTEAAPDIDIYIIPDKRAAKVRSQKRRKLLAVPKITLGDLLKVALVLSAATAISFLFYRAPLSEANIITVYILGVLAVALWTTTWIPGALASLFSVLVFNYFFTHPRFSLHAYDPSYPLTFAVMFIAAFTVNTLMMQIKRHARQTALQAFRTEALLETSQLLQQTTDRSGILRVAVSQLYKLFQCPIICYEAEGEHLGAPLIYRGETARRAAGGASHGAGSSGPRPFGSTFSSAPSADDNSVYQSAEERAVAEWVLHNAKHAGATTDTLPNAKCLYLAVRGQSFVHAVVGLALDIRTEPVSYEKNLMLAIVDEAALALDGERLSREKKNAEFKASQEALRANLLRAISHDLRTPLTSISGNASILMERADAFDSKTRHELYSSIYDDAAWLINLVENLLSVTKLQNGSMSLKLQPELLCEVFSEALLHIDRNAASHVIRTELSDDLLMADMDVRLIVQVIINLINNAVKYTPAGSEIKLSGRKAGKYVMIAVTDNGPGISDEAKPQIFDMFYTANKGADRSRSLGLGLALCRSIVQAHGGEIQVRDANPHGAEFYFTLPAAKLPSEEPEEAEETAGEAEETAAPPEH